MGLRHTLSFMGNHGLQDKNIGVMIRLQVYWRGDGGMHIAIVEDDPRIQAELQAAVERYARENGEQFHTSVFSDGDEILENYAANYDIILLDIQMKRLDGMQTAERIRELDTDVILIFVTQMVNFAVRGYAVNALDFLVKPINYLSLEHVFRRAVALRKKRTQYVTVPTGKGLFRLNASKIYYFESYSHRLIVHAEEGKEYTLRETMRRMEEAFGPYGFFRCNNCFLVNLNYVESVELDTVVVAGHPLTISRPRRKAFMEALTNYLGGVKL